MPQPAGQVRPMPRRSRPGSMAALSALSREARRRRITYGALCERLTEEERERILREWQEEHAETPVEQCCGCVYWRYASATSPDSGKLCHFALDRGHSRRREGGCCLEYRPLFPGRKEPRGVGLGRRFLP